MNETEIVDQLYGIRYQLKICHVFQESVSIYMDSEVSKGFSLLVFEIKEEYALQINFLLRMINYSLIFIYLQEVVTMGWILSWLHWKYDYT